MALFLFDPFFARHAEIAPHRAAVESAFLGLARTIKQRGKIFVAGDGDSRVVSRLLNAPFQPLPALLVAPETDARRQIKALGTRYTDGIWILNQAASHLESLQAARENYFNTVAFQGNSPSTLRPLCDALVECEDVRLVDAICDALETYFSEKRAFESVFLEHERVPTEHIYSEESDFFPDDDPEEDVATFEELEPVARAVMEWEADWKEARSVENGGPTRAETEAQKLAYLNRDWSKVFGVDGWGTHHASLLTRGELEDVGAAIVSLCGVAQWRKDVLGETVAVGKSGYFLYRLAGQNWTIALPYQTVRRADFDSRLRLNLAQQLSRRLQTASFHLDFGDNPGHLNYALWENGDELESMQAFFDAVEDEAPLIFSSRLSPELMTQQFDVYQRCESVMRDWEIYAPTFEADYFSPFDEVLRWRAGDEFQAFNRGLRVYFGATPSEIFPPIERLDHLILTL